ncbi:hypothetical protein AJ79_08853 [Helicocarpus griseus UAMH5409]|uniref:Protein FYV10 n=1 Tax=Helicocarpus griseus UAMH5409 TaxID=1447875 RepID=A0A2B7WPR5_9EURO|nr:hypothetical protein AJ79_08853 [Helicocarpus griseus UAMH5409]
MSNNAPPGGGAPPPSYPPAPTFSSMPRRSSYASVVSGTAALTNSTAANPNSNTSTNPNTPTTTSTSTSAASASAAFLQQQILRHQHYHQQQHRAALSRASSSLISPSATTTPSSSFPPHFLPPETSRPHTSSINDMQANGGGAGGAGVGAAAGTSGWRRSTLPQYSRQFADYSSYPSYLHGSPSLANTFFTPSYLKNSKYIEKLAADQRSSLLNATPSSTPVAAASSSTIPKDPSSSNLPSVSASAANTGGPSLSASSSTVNLHRLAPSHRGMTHDIIEHPPVPEDDNAVKPLPSRWNERQSHSGLTLSPDGLEMRYTGQTYKQDHEAASCRADNPMPPQCGIYYFEVTVLAKPKDGMICVGFMSDKPSLERLPGWEPDSWAYHGDDGRTFSGDSQGQGKVYGPKYATNDTVGCGVNFATNTAFFTRNGVYLGNAFRELKNVKLFPAVGVKKQPDTRVKVNFGQAPFIYDIDGMMKKEKLNVQADISATGISNLHPSLDETTFIQELVAQFLAHGGYVETARAFAEEVKEESKALQNGRATPLKEYQAEDDVDAINRQKIRAAILDGDIDKALKFTNASYANVFRDNPQIYFRLRCRKFIEMMRRCTEPQQQHTSSTSRSKQPARSSNGADTHEDVFTHDMELDEQMNDVVDDGDSADEDDDEENGMDVEATEYNGTNNTANYHDLLHEAILYGQQLQADYPGDERKEYKRTLDDIFSLVAYPDPKSSVHGHLLEPSGRVPVAEELNSAILVSLGKSSSAALERLYQQTEALVDVISEKGGAGAFINVRDDFVA